MNGTLKDIHWLLARLYVITENAGGCIDNVPEYRTLCERYGFNVDETEDAERIIGQGID